MVVRPEDLKINLCAGNGGPHHLGDLHLDGSLIPGAMLYLLLDFRVVRPEVDKGSHHHVSGDPRMVAIDKHGIGITIGLLHADQTLISTYEGFAANADIVVFWAFEGKSFGSETLEYSRDS